MSRSFGSVPSGQGSTAVDGPDTVAYGWDMANRGSSGYKSRDLDEKDVQALDARVRSASGRVSLGKDEAEAIVRTLMHLMMDRVELRRRSCVAEERAFRESHKLSKIQDILSNDYDETDP